MADISGYLKIISGASSGEAVREAIVNCMRAINSDAAIKITSLLITKADNVTYKAGVGQAYKNVTVNISGSGESDPTKTYNFETFTVTESTENGTYSPESENTYYSQVEVNIDWESIAHPANLGEEATMSYTLTDSETGKRYWDASAEGYDYVKRIWIQTDVGNLPGEGTGVKPAGTPIMITFKDTDGTTLQQQQILSGSYPTYTGTTQPTGSGKYYWSPSGPIYKDGTELVPIFYNETYSQDDITDSWKLICSKEKSASTKYPIGSRATMSINKVVNYSWDRDLFPEITQTGTYTYNRKFYCIKVAEHENGSNSSWLCIASQRMLPSHIANIVGNHDLYFEHKANVIRTWLNGTFLNYLIDPEIKPNIKEKEIHFVSNPSSGAVVNDLVNIWLPCIKEIWIPGETTWPYYYGDVDAQYIQPNTKAKKYFVDANISMSDVCNLFSLITTEQSSGLGDNLDRSPGHPIRTEMYSNSYNLGNAASNQVILFGFCI